MRGFEGKTVIDATNLYGVRPPEGFASNAEFVKSRTNGPTAKSFNTNFASLLGRLGEARATPSSLWCGDDEGRDVVERLNRDAGYEPVRVGGLEKAAAQEGIIDLIFGTRRRGSASTSTGWHRSRGYDMKLDGLHHVSAITADAHANLDFYARLLGLRLIWQGANADDPGMRHIA